MINYIAATFTFYEQIKGRGSAPTSKQIQAILAACGVPVALERIKSSREIIRELEQEEADEEETYAED